MGKGIEIMLRSVLLPVTTILVVAVVLSGCSAPAATPSPAPTATTVTAANVPAPAAQDALPAVPKEMYASDPALVRNTGRPQVVEFFAFWCDVCHAMHPTMVALQQAYQQQIDFIYLDIDADNTKGLRQSMGFTGLRPTIVFIAADGTETGRLVGMHSQQELVEQITTILGVG